MLLECLVSTVISTFVFSLHRYWGPGSSQSTGGKCSLQGFTELTHCCLCFPPDCKYSVNKHWISVSCVAGLVICVSCRQTRWVQVSDLLYNLTCTHSLCHWYSVRPTRLGEESVRHNAGEITYCLTFCFHRWGRVNLWVRRISCGIMLLSLRADMLLKHIRRRNECLPPLHPV